MVSVIIPTYNEGDRIKTLINHIKHNSSGFVSEIIVADGKSIDNTISQAKTEDGVIIINCSQRVRAVQMNEGAKIAQGEILHFVHADGIPPKNFDKDLVEQTKKGYRAGCFRSKFNTKNLFLLFFSFFTRFKGLLFRGGGQTLWISKELFDSLGGYTESMYVMEEYDLIRKIRKSKSKFKIIPRNTLISARRYRDNGYIRLHYLYGCIFVGYIIGRDQKKLVQFYKKKVQGPDYENAPSVRFS